MPVPSSASNNEITSRGNAAVLIVDDDARVRRLLGDIVVSALPGMHLGEASDVPEMMEQLASRAWSAVLLDIVMPGRSGLEALPEVRAAYPNLPVLIVSMRADDNYKQQALVSGAADYVPKELASNRLGASIRGILERPQRA